MTETARHKTPYVGLVPYSEADAPFFYGREQECGTIIANLLASRLTLLYGVSGVGKSSVLRAGVAHSLSRLAEQNTAEHGSPELAVIVFSSWRDDPVKGLSQRVSELNAALARPSQHVELPPPDALVKNLQFWTEHIGGELLIILDQFEEYFLYHPYEEGEGTFVAEFPQAVNLPELRANFLVSIRADALDKLDCFKGRIAKLFDNYLRIEHLDVGAARAAIKNPIEKYNQKFAGNGHSYSVEPELVEAVLSQIRAGQVTIGEAGRGAVGVSDGDERIETPFLQLVMTRLWEQERDEGSFVLRHETLTRLGGAEHIVRTHLDKTMDALPPDKQYVAAKAFHYLVTPSRTKIAHSIPDLAFFTGLPQAELQSVMEDLASSGMRILRAVAPPLDKPGGPRYEIFHDVLAAPVFDWGERYGLAQKLRDAQEESDRQLEAERKEKLRERRRANQLRLVLIGMVVMLLLMAGVTVYAFEQRREADRQRGLAEWQTLEATNQRTEAVKQRGEATSQKAEAERQSQLANGALDEVKKTATALAEQKAQAEELTKESLAAKGLAESQKRQADTLKVAAEESQLSLRAYKEKNFDEASRLFGELEKHHEATNNFPALVGDFIDIADIQIEKNPLAATFINIVELTESQSEDSSDNNSAGMIYMSLLLNPEKLEALENNKKETLDEMTRARDEAAANLDKASEFNKRNRELERAGYEGDIEKRRGNLQFLSAMLDSIASEGSEKTESDNVSPLELNKIIAHFDKASAAYKKAGEFEQEAKMLKKIGFLLSEMDDSSGQGDAATGGREGTSGQGPDGGKMEKVTGYYSRAASSFERAGKQSDAASTYKHLGKLYEDLSDDNPDKTKLALSSYESALDIYQKINRPDMEGEIAETLGDLLGDNGEHTKEAIAFYEQARSAFAQAASRYKGRRDAFIQKESENLTKAGGLLGKSKKGDEESYFRKVINSYGDDFNGKAYALRMVADYYKESDKKKALGFYKEEREAWSSAGNPKEEVDLLYSISMLSKSAGESNYTDWLEEALKAYRKIGEGVKDEEGALVRPQLGARLSTIGDAFAAANKKEMAADAYVEALQAYMLAEDSTTNTYTLGHIVQSVGKIYLSEGDERKAGEVFQKVLDYCRSKKDAVEEASMLQTIGALYKEQGRRAEAIVYYEKSLSVYETAGQFSAAVSTLTAIGKIYEEQGEKGKALVDYYRRVAESSHPSNPIREALALQATANFYRESKQNPEALKYFAQARRAYQDAKLIQQEISVLRTMSYIYTELKDKTNADEMTKQADDLAKKKK